MIRLLFIGIAISLMSCIPSSSESTIYNFKVKDINGKTFDFAKLKGKKLLIVNTASECGYTPQYEQLEELYKKYKSKNFEIIGFPANDFGAQEPGSNEEIATFCKKNYGVSFPMMSKITVKGEKMEPVYAFLTQKEKNGVMDSNVKWNFQKYLVNESGKLVKMLPSNVSPMDEQITKWIEE